VFAFHARTTGQKRATIAAHATVAVQTGGTAAIVGRRLFLYGVTATSNGVTISLALSSLALAALALQTSGATAKIGCILYICIVAATGEGPT